MNTSSLSRRLTVRNIVAAGVLAAVLAGGALGVSASMAGQPHMNSALNDLSSALSQLESAIPDKAGHRVAAIGLVRQAIDQTSEGMAAGAI
jgi:hypothetical protein